MKSAAGEEIEPGVGFSRGEEELSVPSVFTVGLDPWKYRSS